ncbi:cancer-associated gene 1 protein [Hipposideros larvatus]
MSLAKNTAKESALNSSEPHSCLCKECVHNDVEKPFYEDKNFNVFDLRANYETKEITVSSKGIQNSGEMSSSHQTEVTVEGVESSGIASACFSEDIPSSGSASQEDCKTPATEQSLESLQPPEENMALNEVLWKLKRANKMQQTLIQNLQSSNMYLKKKVEELQMKPTRPQVFIDILNKLKETAESLIEDKYRVMLEKSDADKTLQNLHDTLTNTQKHLQKSRNEKETLQVELKRIKSNYVCLQEGFITEMQQKNTAVSQCVEMGKALSKKEEEVEKLQQLQRELEKANTSALNLLKREKQAQEQEFWSLQEEFQKRENENMEERQKLKSRLEQLVAQVENLQFISESERAKNTKLQQQINEVKNENAKLQQQVARSEEQNYVPKFEIAQLKEHLEEVMESAVTKDAKMIHSNLYLNCSPCEEESLTPPNVKRNSQLASNIHNLLALTVGLLTCQGTNNPDAEHFKESEKVSDAMLQKLKSFYHKRKNLDEEVTDLDSNEVKNVRDVPLLLGAKLDKYHSLNEKLDFLIAKLGNLLESKEDHCNRLIEENDKYQNHLGNLINKVTAYEEIIKCADQRLKISHSQIAHLEERNKYLEGLIRKPRERARKPRSGRLENHPKSMMVILASVPFSSFCQLATKPRKMKHNQPCHVPSWKEV